MSNKMPDNIVFNHETGLYDANTKHYPTTIGSQQFAPLNVDKSDGLKADRYFNKKLNELKDEYQNLLNEYETTKQIYNTKITFQPNVGETYYMYSSDEGNFLSIIKPEEWDKESLGAFTLNTSGTWKKV